MKSRSFEARNETGNTHIVIGIAMPSRYSSVRPASSMGTLHADSSLTLHVPIVMP